MRGLAALAVVLFHASTPGFTRGYVGVDVFFVLSGFLLASILFAEMASSNGFNFRAYVFRRMRRLLPLSLAVLLATAVAHKLLSNPLRAMEDRVSFVAAGLYHANWRMLWDSRDYFAANEISPVQHYWSLSVEEQLQFVFPLLLWALMAWRGYRTESRAIPIILGLLGLGSMWSTYSAISRGDEMLAYLGTFQRSYQVLAGILVAIVSPKLSKSHRTQAFGSTLSLFALLGFLLIFVGPELGLLKDYSSIFWCGISCALTIGLLLGLELASESIVGWFLSSQLLTRLGTLSYPLYLVHFPVIIIGESIGLPKECSFRIALVLIISLPISLLLHHYIESPPRQFSSNLPNFWILIGLLSSIFTALLCAQVLLGNPFVQELYYNAHPYDFDVLIWNRNQDKPPRLESRLSHPLPSPKLSSSPTFAPSAPNGISSIKTTPTINIALKIVGRPKGARVLVAGDSQAPKWALLLTELSERGMNFTLLKTEWEGGCVMYRTREHDADPANRCTRLLDRVAEIIETGQADLVVFVAFISWWDEKDPHTTATTIRDGITDSLSRWKGAPVLVIPPNNVPKNEIPRCAAAITPFSMPAIIKACSSPAVPRPAPNNGGLYRDLLLEEVPKLEHATAIDVSNFFCPNGICPAYSSTGYLTFSDDIHTSNSYMSDPVTLDRARELFKRNCIDLERGAFQKPCLPAT